VQQKCCSLSNDRSPAIINSLDRLQHFCCTQSYVSLKYVFLSVYISWHTYLVTIWKKANESLEATLDGMILYAMQTEPLLCQFAGLYKGPALLVSYQEHPIQGVLQQNQFRYIPHLFQNTNTYNNYNIQWNPCPPANDQWILRYAGMHLLRHEMSASGNRQRLDV
jgi:hypothetical protein